MELSKNVMEFITSCEVSRVFFANCFENLDEL
jgi:hypothetical protein